MFQGLFHMRFVCLLLSSAIVCGYGREAASTEPVTFHAANAAQAADVAQQAATVAKRVAAHTEEVAHNTAAALRYTRDALKGAGASSEDVEEVGKQADRLEEEAGVEKSEAKQASEIERRDANEASSVKRRQGSEAKQASGAKRRQGSETKEASSRHSSELRDGQEGRSVQDSSARRGSSHRSGGRASSRHRGGGSSESSSESHEDDGNGPRSLDVNAKIAPYPNAVEPFGQEEPAKELTEESIKQSDGMVNQIENAQGVEAKRSVYRALTKLRGATIASYDGMAKGHLANVDKYNKKHSWRKDHPMRHLAEEEADTEVWAFPKKRKSAKKSNKKQHVLPTGKKEKAPTGIAKAPAAAAPAAAPAS